MIGKEKSTQDPGSKNRNPGHPPHYCGLAQQLRPGFRSIPGPPASSSHTISHSWSLSLTGLLPEFLQNKLTACCLRLQNSQRIVDAAPLLTLANSTNVPLGE